MPILRTPVAVLAAAMMGMAGAAQAGYLQFSGTDANGDPETPLTSVPNSATAEGLFKAELAANVATEDFEGQSVGATAPLVLNFTNVSTGVVTSATLAGGSGRVAENDEDGRYSIPSGSTSKFWAVDAARSGDFTISFSQAISAFGFYATDVGDYGGTLSVELLLASGAWTSPFTITHAGQDADGAALFFGLVAEDSDDDFTQIRFRSTAPQTDVFGFDNFTIATRNQLNDDTPPPSPTPIPGTLLLAGLGLAGLGAMRRRVR